MITYSPTEHSQPSPLSMNTAPINLYPNLTIRLPVQPFSLFETKKFKNMHSWNQLVAEILKTLQFMELVGC